MLVWRLGAETSGSALLLEFERSASELSLASTRRDSSDLTSPVSSSTSSLFDSHSSAHDSKTPATPSDDVNSMMLSPAKMRKRKYAHVESPKVDRSVVTIQNPRQTEPNLLFRPTHTRGISPTPSCRLRTMPALAMHSDTQWCGMAAPRRSPSAHGSSRLRRPALYTVDP